MVTLDRGELYKLVWSRPKSQLCREYGISDVGLAKICRKHEIPYPPRGYWAKVRNGQRVHKPPLGPVSDPALGRVEILRRTPSAVEEAARAAARGAAIAEKGVEQRIPVADTLTAPHPLVERTVRSLNSARPDRKGSSSPRPPAAWT